MDAFGAARMNIEDIVNPLRFPGQYFDSETGLHYNRFRYYSPELGRYLSRDPLGFLAGCNFFAYVDNNPINGVDPLGLWWETALSVAAGVAVAGAILLTAPVTLPMLALAAVAAVAVGVGVNKVLNLKQFSLSCALSAFGEGFKKGALIALGIEVAILLFPEIATAVLVAGSGVGIYSMLQEHLGWELFSWEKGSKSYFEMTPEEQNKSLFDLGGIMVGGLAVGKIVRWGEPSSTPNTSKTSEETPNASKTSEEIEQSKPQSSSETPIEEQPQLSPSSEDIEQLTPEEKAQVDEWYQARDKAKSYPGHGDARHGPQTTITEQTQRVQTGEAPDGNTAPTDKATKFDSYEKEVEAVEKARAKNPGDGKAKYKTNKNGNIIYRDGKPVPARDEIVVDDGPEGYGSGVEVQNGVNGEPLPGRPVKPTGQQPNAKVIFEYNPKTNTWEPLTQYPTDVPTKP